ncbi:MAG: hypothetical protein OXH85_01730 [Truepera sp.]|nr:hypothetical protein [Truepera sp.]
MAHNQDRSSNHLTFSQRYGYEPLPEPMRLEELSNDLRREIWNAVRELLLGKSVHGRVHGRDFSYAGKKFIERVLGQFLKRPEDRISTEYAGVMNGIRKWVLEGVFNSTLDLVQIMVNDRDTTKDFVKRAKSLFDQHAAAYWLDMSGQPYQFFPRGSKEQGEATQQAIETLRESNMDGAATHLRHATEHINAQRYANSIVDSIHAVESVARMIDPEASNKLGSALNSLEKAGLLKHTALKEAFKKLYGYTSDEQGIRHALLDRDSSDVGLDEAMFMFGACASFASYLVNKHRQAELAAADE